MLAASAYAGDCTIQRVGFRLDVTSADRQIRIAPELLDEWRIHPHPDVSLADDVLTIRGISKTVTYRIAPDLVVDAYGAQVLLADRVY